MPIVNVGFDGSETQMQYAGPGDELRTQGLGNCIAVVAYDSAGQGAVMRHYDTQHAYRERVPDEISGENALVYDSEEFNALRNILETELRRHVDPPNIRFAVALGLSWWNVDQEKATWKTRHNLIEALLAAFGVEPLKAGDTATFVVNTATLS